MTILELMQKKKFVETIVLLYNEIYKKLFKYSKANRTVKLTPTQTTTI